jgi:hypothetical protein
MSSIKIQIGEDNIYTDTTGVNQLLKFYNKCYKLKDSTIEISFEDVNWFDGNLCSFLGALLYKLNTSNNLTFTVDASQIEKTCNILFSNKFLPVTSNKAIKKTCIPFVGLKIDQKDEFVDYIENELLTHSGMPKLSDNEKELIVDDLCEVYANINKHSEATDPFFVCGQYYPKKKKLIFTITDLGEGFFNKINKVDPKKIKTDGDAILWALEGNTTKKDAPGGGRLKKMKEYYVSNGGSFKLFTGKSMWDSENLGTIMYKNGICDLNYSYIGTSISLFFQN